jgi:hypothetical protein
MRNRRPRIRDEQPVLVSVQGLEEVAFRSVYMSPVQFINDDGGVTNAHIQLYSHVAGCGNEANEQKCFSRLNNKRVNA